MNHKYILQVLLLILSATLAATAQLPTRLKSSQRALFMYGPAPHFQNWDSTYYVYSGQRGSNLSTNVIKFDTSWHYMFDASLNPIPANRTIQTFDANSNILSKVEQAWNNSQWENVRQKQYSYNGALISQMIENIWNINQWILSTKQVYNYSGTQLDSISNFAWLGTSWGQGNPMSFRYTNNILDTITDFDKRLIFVYDINGTLVKTISQYLISTNWINKSQILYRYNTVGINDTLFIQEWLSNTWQDKKRVELGYDTKDNLIKSLSNSWSMFTNSWEPMETHSAPLNTTVDTLKSFNYETIPNLIADVQKTKPWIYPVPAKDIINVIGYENRHLELLNSDGRTILKGQAPLHVRDLPSGIYYLQTDVGVVRVPILNSQ